LKPEHGGKGSDTFQVFKGLSAAIYAIYRAQ